MTLSPPLVVRSAAAAAALVLAVLSRGDAAVLALVLVVVAGRPWAVLAVGPALAAVAWRWGAASLEALAGYQSVLGPAGWTGSGPRVASAWLAAAALVLSTPRLAEVGGGPGGWRRPARPNVADPEVGGGSWSGGPPDAPNLGHYEVGGRSWSTGPPGAPNLGGEGRASHRGADGRLHAAAVPADEIGAGAGSFLLQGVRDALAAGAFGASAAVVVAGPGAGGDLWVRVLATVVGVALALGAVALRDRWHRWLDVGASVAGVGSLALVAGADPPRFAAALDADATATGLAIAVAVAAAVGVADRAWRARSGRRPVVRRTG